MSRALYIAIALLIGLGASVVIAQESASSQAAPQPESSPPAIGAGGFSSDYEVGPGDVLEVQVVGQEELKESLRVSSTGDIHPSALGRVRVLDMTTFEVEETIARLLREGDLVKEPEVLVDVQEFRARPIHMLGAVMVPGQFVMSETMTVVDAILMAKGLRFNASDEALIHRRLSPGAVWSPAALAARPGEVGPDVEVIKVDIKPLKKGQFSTSSPVLKRGDVVVIPEQLMAAFFVVGDVNHPSNFAYPPKEQLKVSQAISMAGGPTLTAKMSEGMLVRYDRSGARTEQKVDYAAILSGRQPDFNIQPNDLIFIPGSAIKTVAQGLVRVTGNAMMSTAFRIGRTYQLPEAPNNTTTVVPQ